MKKIILLAAVSALSACGSKPADPAATDTAANTVETPAPATSAPATGSMVGTYEMTSPDGTIITETINADGTYVDVAEGKETRGTWRMEGESGCFDPAGDAPEICYTTTAPAADGSFTTKAPDGTTMTVRKTTAQDESGTM